MKKRRKALRIVCTVLVILFLLTGAELLYSNFALTVSYYSVSSEKITQPFRVVFLSDLHGREFGAGNRRLLEKIAQQQPDYIFLGGDIFNRDADDAEIDSMCAFIRSAAEIAPVYFGMGNHEMIFEREHDLSLRERITEAGAVVLEAEYLDLSLKGNPVRLAGYMSYYRAPMNVKDLEERNRLLAFADEFEHTDRYSILINHISTTWVDWNGRNKFPVDLVLTGHYHGGVMRIPILEQGLYAPYVGWFPPYTKGLYPGTTAVCIITAGLAGYRQIPRFFNPPEICTVDICPSAE